MTDLYRFTENSILREYAWGTAAEAEQFAALNGYLCDAATPEQIALHGDSAEHLDDMLNRTAEG